jgi:hypothetical protein
METISAISPVSDRRHVCQAFTIQSERKNVSKLLDILCNDITNSDASLHFTNSDTSLRFTTFSQRGSDLASFAKLLDLQTACTNHHRIVAIKGIRPDHMFQFDVELRKTHPEILQVFRTPTTNYLNCGGEPIGRYNLLCKTKDFVTLANTLNTTLAETYRTFLQRMEISTFDTHHAEDVCVVSRFPLARSPGSQTSITTSGPKRVSPLAYMHVQQ